MRYRKLSQVVYSYDMAGREDLLPGSAGLRLYPIQLQVTNAGPNTVDMLIYNPTMSKRRAYILLVGFVRAAVFLEASNTKPT